MTHSFSSVLKRLSPDNYGLLRDQLIDSAIFSANFLEVASLIFNKAVNEPTLCPMYARLCYDLSENLPPYPTEDDVAKDMSFKRVLVNICQESFERVCNQRVVLEQEVKQTELKLRILGNIRFIGELFNLRMIPVKVLLHILQELLVPKNDSRAKELQIEVVCQLLNTAGKHLDEINSPLFRDAYDVFFQRFKELGSNVELSPRIKYIVYCILSLLSNHWVPKWEENAENGDHLWGNTVRATDIRHQLESVETTTEEECTMEKMKMKYKKMKDLMIKTDNKVIEIEKRCIILECEARKSAKGERYCLIALVLSWLFSAIIMYYKM